MSELKSGTYYRATGLDRTGESIAVYEFKVHTHEGHVYPNVDTLSLAMDDGMPVEEFLAKYRTTKREAVELLKETRINKVKQLHKDIDALMNMHRVATLDLTQMK